MPTSKLKVRFQLGSTEADCNGDRKIIHFKDMPIWEDIINIGRMSINFISKKVDFTCIADTAYCDISDNQSNAFSSE